jgi:hypothetical protein
MPWLAATALVASTPQGAPKSMGAMVQARATVRIISGVPLRLDGHPNSDAPPARDSVVHTEGAPQPAKLIEFQ